MKKIFFAIGAMAVGVAAVAPAHADYAIVKFSSGVAAYGLTRLWRLQTERSFGLCGDTTVTTTCRAYQLLNTSLTWSSLGTCAGTSEPRSSPMVGVQFSGAPAVGLS